MKNLPKILLFSVAAAVVAAIIIHFLCQVKKARRAHTLTASDIDFLRAGTNFSGAFPGLNFNLPLNGNTHNGEGEIVALQMMINEYYGKNVIPVTGQWDQATDDALWEITGKSSTNLYEFRYYYLSEQVGGDELATEIFQYLTAQ